MKSPDYPTNQPKNPVDDALVDRNSDPDASRAPSRTRSTATSCMENAPDNDKPLIEGSLEGERPRSDH